ncbi:hypothetical protein AY599_28005 [Leptolyngbya valderiana BDU 20041]|nr:hypothetical protein AY599_28005 [Leptolyngbya valderiana BDU 20041]
MSEHQARTHLSAWSLIAAMAVGLFVLGPLTLLSIAWAPAIIPAFVIAVVVIYVLSTIARQDKGIASTRVGVRGKRFAELVRPTGLSCPRCGYDLSGASDDRCTECAEDLELIVRTQVHYELVESGTGPSHSDRDMRGLAADTAAVLGYAILLPALVAPASIIVMKAASGRTPAIFSMAAVVYMGWSAWRWWRRQFSDDLPRQRTEAVLSLALVAGLSIVCAAIDLLY